MTVMTTGNVGPGDEHQNHEGDTVSDPKEETERSGSGGSSDGDTQPDDTGATGTLADADHATGEQKANQNREDELPA